MINISRGGCGIESEVSPDTPQNLRLYLVIPVRQTTVVVDVASVRWVRSGLFGVEFITVQPDSQGSLTRWITGLAAEDG